MLHLQNKNNHPLENRNMTHADAMELVSGKNNRMQRKVANNTTARIKPDGSVAFMLYSTDVVTIHDDDSVTLRHGGHKTDTTKNRINRFSSFYVRQENWEWYLNDGTPFEDGMWVK